MTSQENAPESPEKIGAESKGTAISAAKPATEPRAEPATEIEAAPDKSKSPAKPTGAWRVQVLRLLTLAGIALSLYLVYQHARHVSGFDSQAGLCSLIKGSNCAKVENSAFSELAGMPTAAWGAFYFLTFFIFSVFGPRVDWRSLRPIPLPASGRRGPKKAAKVLPAKKIGREFWEISTLLAVLGLIGSLTFATIAISIVKAFCVGCAGVYALTALQAAALVGAGKDMFFIRALKGVPAGLRAIKVILKGPAVPGVWGLRGGAMAFVLLVPGLFVAPDILKKRMIPAAATEVLKFYETAPAVEFREEKDPAAETPNILRKGPATAPVRIVVFTDFLCRHCKHFNGELKKALEEFSPNQYTVVYKHFPIEGLCNPLVQRLVAEGRLTKESEHVGACQLAAMSQALHSDYGKFWENSSDLYVAVSVTGETGPVPSGPEQIMAIAKRAGVDFEDWKKKAGAKSNLKLVEDDVFEATVLGITSIPAIFINNKRIPNPLGADVSLIMRSILAGDLPGKPAEKPEDKPAEKPAKQAAK